jgi:hypothetical protein
LKEFFVDRQVPFFTDYVKTYTDLPFLITLTENTEHGGLVPGKFLTEADLLRIGSPLFHFGILGWVASFLRSCWGRPTTRPSTAREQHLDDLSVRIDVADRESRRQALEIEADAAVAAGEAPDAASSTRSDSCS